MIADRIMAAAQRQLVGQAERIIPIQTRAPLLLAGAALAAVVPRQPDAPGLLRGVFDQHITAAHGLARRQFHLRLVRRQAVELVDHLLDFAQVEQLAGFAGETHRQLAVGDAAAFGAFQTFEFAFDHLELEVAAGKVLLRQVGAAGDQPFSEVAVGDDLEHFIELRHAQALADVGPDQRGALAFGQRVGAGEFDGFDREATGIHGRGRRCRRGGFAGQVLEVFEALLLLFEQAVLAVANQIGDARGVLRRRGVCHAGKAQAKKSGQQGEPGPTFQTPHL